MLLLIALPAKRAEAHASLLSSTPSTSAIVASTPFPLRLVFNEPIVAELSHVALISSDGKMIDVVVRSDPHEVRALIGTLPPSAAGGYRLDWHVISADGHPVSGTIPFSVGAAAAPPPPMSLSAHGHGQSGIRGVEPIVAGAALLPALFRGAALSALLAVCGLLGFTSYSSARTKAQERLCTWLSVTATVLLAVHLVVWLIHVSPANKLDATIARNALTREVGLNELLRLIFAALAMWSVALARRWRIGFAFALAAVLAGGTIGHPAAIVPLITVPAKAMHLVGAAFWFGGILWLTTIETDSVDLLPAAMTVSSIALISIAVVTITGVVQVFFFLSSWREIFSSAYGLTVLGKTAGLLSLFAFGAYHRSSLLPRLPDDAASTVLKRSIKREIVVMVAVVMLGGFLAYVPVPSMVGM